MVPPFRLCALFCLALAIAWLSPATDARAQQATAIAAVVNDDAVSLLDVVERLELVLATAGIDDDDEVRRHWLPQVLEALVEERLVLQEGARIGLAPLVIDLEREYRRIEGNLGLAAGRLPDFMAFHGLSLESLNRQIEARAMLETLALHRLRAGQVGEEDIDDALARLRAAADEPAFLLAELFLAVDRPEDEPEIAATMARLRAAIVDGASFLALARQFSQRASAGVGGDLGWMVASRLAEEWHQAVPALAPGEVSQPLRVAGGFVLVLMRDRRPGAAPEDERIVLRQLLFPVADGDDEDERQAVLERARARAEALAGCAGLDAAGEGTIAGPPLEARLGDLQPALRQAVAGLEAGRASAPFAGEEGWHVAVVCQRLDAAQLPSRDEMRRLLEAERFDLAARGYLRDLRRQAFVELRL